MIASTLVAPSSGHATLIRVTDTKTEIKIFRTASDDNADQIARSVPHARRAGNRIESRYEFADLLRQKLLDPLENAAMPGARREMR
jgi:hypothetical protein